MLKKIATMLIFLLLSLVCIIQIAEAQEDYSYVLGLWESRIGPRTGEITIKEIFLKENKAVVFVKYPAVQTRDYNIPAGSYEVNNALFKPGPEPVIEFKSPTTGYEISLRFKKDGTGESKTVTTRGGEAGIQHGDLKKK